MHSLMRPAPQDTGTRFLPKLEQLRPCLFWLRQAGLSVLSPAVLLLAATRATIGFVNVVTSELSAIAPTAAVVAGLPLNATSNCCSSMQHAACSMQQHAATCSMQHAAAASLVLYQQGCDCLTCRQLLHQWLLLQCKWAGNEPGALDFAAMGAGLAHIIAELSLGCMLLLSPEYCRCTANVYAWHSYTCMQRGAEAWHLSAALLCAFVLLRIVTPRHSRLTL